MDRSFFDHTVGTIGSKDATNMVNTNTRHQLQHQNKPPKGYNTALIYSEDTDDSSDQNTKESQNFIGNLRNNSATSFGMSSTQDSEDEGNTDDDNIENYDEENLNSDDEDECKFGKILSKQSLKSILFEDVCLCACMDIDDDSVSGWSRPKKTKKSKSVKTRTKSAFSQVPTAYLRISSSVKNNDFKFHHYKDIDLYIKQYRINHVVGDVCSEYKDDDVTLPDPYDFKLKTNIGTPSSKNETMLNENDNRKIGVDGDDDDDEDDDEKLIKMSVKERGKNLNLAPVRASTAVRKNEMKVAKKTLVPFNPYLNLIIPKTTLNQADVQLNIEARRSQTPRFESSRVVVSKAQANFRDGATVSKSADPYRKITSPADRANEVRLLRTTTYPLERPLSSLDMSIKSTECSKNKDAATKFKDRVDSATFRKQPTISHTPLVQTLKINGLNSYEEIQPLVVPNSPRNETKYEREHEVKYRFKFLDTVQKMPERIRHDTVVPLSVGAFSLRGKTCVPDEGQLSLQRIRKERQSRTGVTL